MCIIVDSVEKGGVPILISFRRMKRVRMKLVMRLDRVLITLRNPRFASCTGDTISSSHIGIDLAAIFCAPTSGSNNGEDFHSFFVGDRVASLGGCFPRARVDVDFALARKGARRLWHLLWTLLSQRQKLQ